MSRFFQQVKRNSHRSHTLIGLGIAAIILLLSIGIMMARMQQEIVFQREHLTRDSAYLPLRDVGQLQREHLRFMGQVWSAPMTFDAESFTLQRQLLVSRIHALEQPFYRERVAPEFTTQVQEYRAAWEQLQPQIDAWMATPASRADSAALLADLEQMELMVNQLGQLGFRENINRNITWSDTFQSAFRTFSIMVVGFILLLVLLAATVWLMFRRQWEIQQALRLSEARNRMMVEAIPDTVLRIAADGMITAFKPARDSFSATTGDRVIGHQLSEWVDIIPVDLISSQVHATLAQGAEQKFTVDVPDSATGEALLYEVRMSPSGLHEVQVIARDITQEQRQAEMLAQTQKLESLGVLAGGIAHDFNNLLTGMLGQTSLAKMKLPDDSPAIRHIDRATRSAERAADLTRQLTAYAGKGQFVVGELDLNQLLRENVDLLSTAMPNQTEFLLEIEEDLPCIHADRGQIQQVVMNLVINAAEALPPDGGDIVISSFSKWIDPASDLTGFIYHEPAAGHYVGLTVHDNGCGMDNATIERIFDPFFSTKEQGHGLGLSATLGIIRTYNGALKVESEPGVGSRFTVLFPALDAQGVESEASRHATGQQADLQLRILVVDDDTEVRETICDMLQSNGLELLQAEDGATGIELYRAQQDAIDLVILDMKMAGLSGPETFERLKAIDPAVRVILSSGYSETEIDTHFGRHRPTAFIQKPYDHAALLALVHDALAASDRFPEHA